MRGTERALLNRHLLDLEAELEATRAAATALADEVAGLRHRLDLALGKARPIPSAEPGEGAVGVAIYLDGREWDFLRGTSR